MPENSWNTDLLRWYQDHRRSFPWRQDPTPYKVWISEIMLQQTRIEAALPYYERFLARLPDIRALAEVPEDELLKLWEGLGYYSRARNLQKAAQTVMLDFDGRLPADVSLLRSLPGIGDYTAGAIASIAFSLPEPAIDGNVMRVFSRLTGDGTDVLSSGAKKHYADLVRPHIPPEHPGDFNEALMELGETVCLPNTAPLCGSCPLAASCVACRERLTDRLPVRESRQTRRIEQRRVALIVNTEDEPRVLLHQRDKKGLLAGLWELPNALDDTEIPLPGGCIPAFVRDLPTAKHIFSHVEWHMSGQLFSAEPCPTSPAYAWATLSEVQTRFALPSAFRAYAALLPELLAKRG